MYDAALELPSGWKEVIREVPFGIEPGEVVLRLVSFSVPSDAPTKEYSLRYTVRDRAKAIHEASAPIVVVVPRIVLLELSLLQAPRFAVAGSAFVTEFVLTNRGNSPTVVRLRCRSSDNYPIRMDSAAVQLGLKESRNIQVSVTPDTRSAIFNHTLELEATSMLDTTVSERISSVVEIVERASKVKEDYLMFPVSLRVREVGQDGKYFTQGELSGSGSLNERGTDQLDFLFRAPETQSVSSLGLRDEYRVSYTTDSLRFFAGDQNYWLSPLTEVGRYATGIGANTAMGKLSAGGFYNESRWLIPGQKEVGGFFDYQVKPEASIGINYLGKRGQSSSDVGTIRGLFTPLSGNILDLEVGAGGSDAKSNDAVAARLDGIQKMITYDLQYVQAGKYFGGYYQDMNFFSASVNAQVTRELRIQSYMRLENRNLSHDTLQMVAPHEAYYQVGAGYADYISVFYRNVGTEDRFDSVKYRNRENAVQARVGDNFSTASVYANMDIGTITDELDSREVPFKRLSLYSSFRPSVKQNYSVSLDYEETRDTVAGNNQDRLSANLNAWILFGQSTQMQLYLFESRLAASPVQTNSMFEASVEHVLPFNHRVKLRGRLTVNSPSRTFAYVLEYIIPIAIPFRRITAVGQLRGFLIGENGKGIANILLNIGEETALSDKGGAFFFASIKPGAAYLIVDRTTLGFQNITSQLMPLELSIRGGEETKITLSVTRSVSVAGSITLFAAKNPDILDTSTVLVEVGEKPGVFLELSNSTEVHRRVSDNQGKFLFADLRPGSWMLKVTGGDIPEYEIVDPDSVMIDLTPGEKKDVNIQFRPPKRSIKILQEGATIKQTPAR